MTLANATSTTVATVSLTATRVKRRLSSPVASGIVLLLAVLWTLPTFGLLVTSFRTQGAIDTSGWWTSLAHGHFTLGNYRSVLSAHNGGQSLTSAFIDSVVICVPAVVIPIGLALLAAYALVWTHFRGRDFLFVVIFALQVVPIQVTLVPLLNLAVHAHIAGTFWPVWIADSIYALPLAVFLLHNFMVGIPAELVESAQVEGANHVQIFVRIMLPLLGPAIAAFAIFQFLWVWNDLLVALTFADTPNTTPMTVALANLSGNLGQSWYLLSAAAFVSMLLPLVVFISLQRFFVRGLLAGSVK